MTRFISPNDIIHILESEITVAVTAPLIINNRVRVGLALSDKDTRCLDLEFSEFKSLCPSLYGTNNATVAYHGLKRIWEFIDERNLCSYSINRHVNTNKIIDTHLMAYLLAPDSSKEIKFGDNKIQERLTLAHVAHRYLDREYPYRITEIHNKPSLDLVAEMLAYDAALIYELALKLPSLMSLDLQRLYRNIETPLMPLLNNMRRVGIGFDGAKCWRLRAETEQEMADLTADISANKAVDLTSHEDIYNLLVTEGVPVLLSPSRIKRGDLKGYLERIASDYPIARKILALWDMERDLAFLYRGEGISRIHPVWGQTRSTTSRIYARNPAVQNVSRKFRQLFVPAAGHVLIQADYSQAQMRIIAHLSGDLELMRIFNNPNGDVHAETSQWLGLNDRTVAKEINFAICFGMGAAGLCRKINELKESQGYPDFISEQTAQSYIDGFYGRFPKVKEFFTQKWENMKQLAPQERAVRSLAGRERCFPRRPTLEMERQFRVTWTQQMEADLIKTAMLRLDRIFRHRSMNARIVMIIHDSIWVECPEEAADDVKHMVKRMMTTAGKLRVPLDVDFS